MVMMTHTLVMNVVHLTMMPMMRKIMMMYTYTRMMHIT